SLWRLTERIGAASKDKTRMAPSPPSRPEHRTLREKIRRSDEGTHLGIDRISRLRASVALIFDDHKVFLTILRRRFDPFLTRDQKQSLKLCRTRWQSSNLGDAVTYSRKTGS